MRIALQLADRSADRTGAQVGRGREFDPPTIRVGRDPSNDLVLEDPQAVNVSRHHAELRYADGGWRLVDLKSMNGTFVNGRRVTEGTVRDGDVVSFGSQGPKLRVSLPTAGDAPVAARRAPAAPAATIPDVQGPSWSTMLPYAGGLRQLLAKGHLVEAMVAVIAITGFMWAMGGYLGRIRSVDALLANNATVASTGQGTPVEQKVIAARIIQAGDFLEKALALMVYFLTAASVYAVYLVAGKRKPWWVLAAAAGATIILVEAVHPTLLKPLMAIRAVVLGGLDEESMNVGEQFVHALFRAAIPEELLKITPALVGLWLMHRARQVGASTDFSHFEVREPLDGILLGVAAGAGFIAVEGVEYAVGPTMEAVAPLFVALKAVLGGGAQVPNEALTALDQAIRPALNSIKFAGGEGMFQAVLRGIDGVFGHLAYSGIVGYYVGQAAIRPAHGGRLVAQGFATAVLLHAAWNSMNDLGPMALVLPFAAYAALAACILKARKDSPTRAENFATSLA